MGMLVWGNTEERSGLCILVSALPVMPFHSLRSHCHVTADVLQKIKVLSGPASVFLEQTYYLYVCADFLRQIYQSHITLNNPVEIFSILWTKTVHRTTLYTFIMYLRTKIHIPRYKQ